MFLLVWADWSFSLFTGYLLKYTRKNNHTSSSSSDSWIDWLTHSLTGLVIWFVMKLQLSSSNSSVLPSVLIYTATAAHSLMIFERRCLVYVFFTLFPFSLTLVCTLDLYNGHHFNLIQFLFLFLSCLTGMHTSTSEGSLYHLPPTF